MKDKAFDEWRKVTAQHVDDLSAMFFEAKRNGAIIDELHVHKMGMLIQLVNDPFYSYVDNTGKETLDALISKESKRSALRVLYGIMRDYITNDLKNFY